VLLRLRRQCQRLARPDAALDIARTVRDLIGMDLMGHVARERLMERGAARR
jgi:hypothetical protein